MLEKKQKQVSQTWQKLNRKLNEHKCSFNVVLTEKMEEVRTEVFWENLWFCRSYTEFPTYVSKPGSYSFNKQLVPSTDRCKLLTYELSIMTFKTHVSLVTRLKILFCFYDTVLSIFYNIVLNNKALKSTRKPRGPGKKLKLTRDQATHRQPFTVKPLEVKFPTPT